MKYVIKEYDEIKNCWRSMKDLEAQLKEFEEQKECIEKSMERLKNKHEQLERLTLDLEKETKQELEVIRYKGCLELHFKKEQPDKQTIERQATEVIRQWVKLYELITPGLLAYWKYEVLIFRFPRDEKEIIHFEHSLNENESNIIFE